MPPAINAAAPAPARTQPSVGREWELEAAARSGVVAKLNDSSSPTLTAGVPASFGPSDTTTDVGVSGVLPPSRTSATRARYVSPTANGNHRFASAGASTSSRPPVVRVVKSDARAALDGAEAFDDVPLDYKGELWLEISPRSFSVRVKAGSKLSQVRFRSRNSQQRDKHTFTLEDAEIRKRHLGRPLVDGPLDLREGVVLRIDLGGLGEDIVGYRAIKNSDVIDVNRVRGYAMEDFWEPIHAREDRRLILDPDQFYILASRERVQIPADLAAEMASIDPAIGEFRVHYAGFFDPGFGQGADGRPSARAVLEVRSRDVPFLLEDAQPVGRLVFEKLAGAADELYGSDASSNYQHQGLKLSKHFRV